jgi:hypothetical protein
MMCARGPWGLTRLVSRPYPLREELSDPTFWGGTSRYASGCYSVLDNSCAPYYWLETRVRCNPSGAIGRLPTGFFRPFVGP